MIEEIDPEERDILGPRVYWQNPADREALSSLLFDYLKVDRRTGLTYSDGSFRHKEGDLVAWTTVSASQIENYQKCKRLWFFKSVARMPEAQKGNQALGEAVHLLAELSHVVEKGSLPREGYEYNQSDVKLDSAGWDTARTLAGLIVPMIPRSRDGIQVMTEAKIVLPTYDGGPTLIGYTDLAIPPGIGWPELSIPKEAAIIGDYKTTSDFRYMKSPAELADSVQMMTYAKWAISDDPGVTGSLSGDQIPREVYLAHLYARTKPPFTSKSIRNSVACVTSQQIETKWEKILDTVRAMDHDAKASDAQEVEPTGVANDHCGAYGGCAFRDKCGLPATNPIASLFSIRKKPEENPMTATTQGGSPILARIQQARAEAAAKANGTPVPESKPTQGPATPEPAKTPEPTPAPAVASKGQVSDLMTEISALASDHGKPMLSGLLPLLLGKETGLQISPGTSLMGSGTLVGVTCKTMGDLKALRDKLKTEALASTSPASEPTKIPESAPATGIVPVDAPPREQAVITKPSDGIDPIKANAAVISEPASGDDDEGEDAGEASTGSSEPASGSSASSSAATPGKRGRPSNAEKAAREAAEKTALEAEIERRVAEKLKGYAPNGPGSIQASINDQQARDLLIRDQEIERLTKEIEVIHSRARQAPAPATPGLVIYFDAYPTKGKPEGAVDYLDWYGPIAQAVAEVNGVADWRLIDYKGKGILATYMREAVRGGALPTAILISSQHPGADVAMEVLSPVARQIIRRM